MRRPVETIIGMSGLPRAPGWRGRRLRRGRLAGCRVRSTPTYPPGMVATASIDAGTRSGAVLNVSLAGAGFIGRVHARCIAANPGTRNGRRGSSTPPFDEGLEVRIAGEYERQPLPAAPVDHEMHGGAVPAVRPPFEQIADVDHEGAGDRRHRHPFAGEPTDIELEVAVVEPVRTGFAPGVLRQPEELQRRAACPLDDRGVHPVVPHVEEAGLGGGPGERGAPFAEAGAAALDRRLHRTSGIRNARCPSRKSRVRCSRGRNSTSSGGPSSRILPSCRNSTRVATW